MAITQGIETSYKNEKVVYWTEANSFITAIGLGDVIAYKNNKTDDGMFYVVKVTNKQMFMNNDVILTVKGVRFKFEGLGTVGTTPAVDYARILVGDIFYGKDSTGRQSTGGYVGLGYAGGFCHNGKPSVMSGGSGTPGMSGTPSACISYAEFFDNETLTISGLLHGGTTLATDDITQITVLPDKPGGAVSSYNTKTDAINKFLDNGTSHSDPEQRYLLYGIARQLAWNFKYSVV